MKITFLGGVGTVTGSKYLLEHQGRRFLIDCGLFQGFKQLRLRNWAPLPVAPSAINSVLLTHAHLDHSGYLPLLVKHGFNKKVICTSATRDLCGILLPDSGHLQEQDATFANRHHFSRHHPALPLYTTEDALECLKNFSSTSFHKPVSLAPNLEARFLRAGHILGAAMVEIAWEGRTLLFSGDLGRPNDPVIAPPERVSHADWLVVESTYGNRKHSSVDAEDVLADAIRKTVDRGGTVVIPAFAVGRSQSLLVLLHKLKAANRIPDLPIFFDSPMAIDATEVFEAHKDDHRLTDSEVKAAFSVAQYIRDPEESKGLDQISTPKVIVSASGMATGGRVLHHLKSYAPDRRNLVLFSGFQAGGTRGAAMLAGAKSIKIHGQLIPVEAEVRNLDMLSAHADADEILAWLRNFERPLKATFITHGEPDAADALRKRISDELGWECVVPAYRDDAILI